MSLAFPSAAGLGIAFRPCRDEDLAFLRRLYASTRAEELASTGWPEQLQSSFLAQQFDAQHRHYAQTHPDAERLVIERGGAPVGRLLVDDTLDKLMLIDISLLPEARGGGIGGAIMADLVAHAEAGARIFSLYVMKGNPARRLYERFGFAQVADEGLYDRLERAGTG
jgi:ribosomal protein S18 acetylase RimI-like enzyme